MIVDTRTASEELKQASPQEIIRWGLEAANRPVLTTNFGPFSAVLVHMVTREQPDIPVIWIDSGYNTRQTYLFAEKLIDELKLNIEVYTPLQTSARRDALMGIPDVDDPLHQEFTEQVKLEPFRRAFDDASPDVWFTGIRREQTEFRKSLDIVTRDQPGDVAKVAPVFYWREKQMSAYLEKHGLANETRYFDPTKVLQNRECGLHSRLIA